MFVLLASPRWLFLPRTCTKTPTVFSSDSPLARFTSHLYGMAAVQCIQVKSTGVICRHKLGPDVVLWEAVVYTQIFNPGCKSLIKPQMGPPLLCTKHTSGTMTRCRPRLFKIDYVITQTGLSDGQLSATLQTQVCSMFLTYNSLVSVAEFEHSSF